MRMHLHSGMVLLTLGLALLSFDGVVGADTVPPTASSAAAKSGSDSSVHARLGDYRGIEVSSQVIEAAESAEGVHEKRQSEKFRVLDLDSSTSRWIMFLTAGMLAIAAVQALFFFVQLRLMKQSMKVAESASMAAKRSVEIMQDTACRQLRAYVSTGL